MTVDAVRDRTKTVTRRHVDTWRNLKPGDRLTLIEKGMGLPKGARQVVLAEVEVVDVRVEPVGCIAMESNGTAREGLPRMTADEFVAFWCAGHGYGRVRLDEAPAALCRRIEWRYLDDRGAPATEHLEEIEQCGRCGSSAYATTCELCPSLGWYIDPNPNCPHCDGTGTVWLCASSAEWCEAHPLPGRDDWERHVVEFLSIAPASDQEGR